MKTCADFLVQLTENVHKSIEKAKKRIADMPHAKKKLNPLWALLSEPLGQIIAAVGLLLSGVLGLVGKLVRHGHRFIYFHFPLERTWLI